VLTIMAVYINLFIPETLQMKEAATGLSHARWAELEQLTLVGKGFFNMNNDSPDNKNVLIILCKREEPLLPQVIGRGTVTEWGDGCPDEACRCYGVGFPYKVFAKLSPVVMFQQPINLDAYTASLSFTGHMSATNKSVMKAIRPVIAARDQNGNPKPNASWNEWEQVNTQAMNMVG